MGRDFGSDERRPWRPLLWSLLLASWVCWVFGITLPIAELLPFPVLQGQDLGLGPELLPSEALYKSTLQTLRLLLESGCTMAFTILLNCSVIIPMLKLIVASLALGQASALPLPTLPWLPWAVAVLASFSSYQFLDLFVGLLLVALCSSECFEARLRAGFALFGTYCVLSQVLLLALARGLHVRPAASSARPTPRPVLSPTARAGMETEHDSEIADTEEGALLGPNKDFPSAGRVFSSTDGHSVGARCRAHVLRADPRAAAINGGALAALALLGGSAPMLDTVVTLNGIYLCRQQLGLRRILDAVGSTAGGAVALLLALSVVVVPLAVALLGLAGAGLAAETGRWWGVCGKERVLQVAALLSPWIMADVFALSLATFLFTVQGEYMQTAIPHGALLGVSSEWFSGFYVGLGLGAAGFSLKWKVLQCRGRADAGLRRMEGDYQLVPGMDHEGFEDEDDADVVVEAEGATAEDLAACAPLLAGQRGAGSPSVKADEGRPAAEAPWSAEPRPGERVTRGWRAHLPGDTAVGRGSPPGAAHAEEPLLSFDATEAHGGAVLSSTATPSLRPGRLRGGGGPAAPSALPAAAPGRPRPGAAGPKAAAAAAVGPPACAGDEGPSWEGGDPAKAPAVQPLSRDRDDDGPVWEDWECPEDSSASRGGRGEATLPAPPAPLAPVAPMGSLLEEDVVDVSGSAATCSLETAADSDAEIEVDTSNGAAVVGPEDLDDLDAEDCGSPGAGVAGAGGLFHISAASREDDSDPGDAESPGAAAGAGAAAAGGAGQDTECSLSLDSEAGSEHYSYRCGGGLVYGRGKGYRYERLRRLISHPIFHTKAPSWIVWALCYLCVKSPAEITYVKVNRAIEHTLPILNTVLNRTLPAALGDCAGIPPPVPCAGDGPLFSEQINSSHWGTSPGFQPSVLVHWLGGVNGMQVSDASVHVFPGTMVPVQLEIRGTIERPWLSLGVRECASPAACKPLWEGDGGCCRPHRGFELLLLGACVDGTGGGPAGLRGFRVEQFSVDELFYGFERPTDLQPGQLGDLAPRAEQALQLVATEVFDSQAVFLNMTFTQLVTRLWRHNAAHGAVRCADLVHDV